MITFLEVLLVLLTLASMSEMFLINPLTPIYKFACWALNAFNWSVDDGLD
jgi:hypothetical protein